MTKLATITRMQLKAITLSSVSTAPIAGAGVAAARGSIRAQSSSGGRQWIKRGTTDTGWISLMLRDFRYFNVRDFGAVGDGVTNDRVAINAAKSAAQVAGGGVVFFPPGVYAVQRNGITASIQLTGVNGGNILFLGCGRGSRILMSGDAGGGGADWQLFDIINGAFYVGFKNLCFDGSAQTNVGTGQQHHLIKVGAAGTLSCGRVMIVDCYWNQTDGDGLRVIGISGVSAAQAQYVTVVRGVFTMDVGKASGSRAGMTISRNSVHVHVRSSYLTGSSDQVLDIEATGTGEITDLILARNHLQHSAPLSTTVCQIAGRTTIDVRHIMVTWNIFDGGALGLFDLRQLTLSHNVVTVSRFATQGDALHVDGIGQSVFWGNQFYRADTTNSQGSAINVVPGSLGSERLLFVGCIAENDSNSVGGQDCVNGESTNQLLVDACLLYVRQSVANAGTGARFRAIDANATDNACRRTLCVGTGAQIRSAIAFSSSLSGLTCGDSVAFGNVGRNSLNGVGFSAVVGATLGPAVASANVCVTASQMIDSPTPAPQGVCVGGNAGPLARGIWEFLADPNTRIVSQIGAFGCNRAGGAGTTLYVKEAGAGLATGWDAK